MPNDAQLGVEYIFQVTSSNNRAQYGVFQTYYETNLLRHNSPSQISWVGSIQGFLLLFGGALVGPVYDAGYFFYLNVVGNLFVVFGLMMTRYGNRKYNGCKVALTE